MRSTILWAALGAVALATMPGCGEGRPEPGRYYARADGFSIRFPADWERKENVMGAAVMALSPQEAGDAPRANVNVAMKRLAPPMDLESYLTLGLANLERLLAEGETCDVVDAELGGSPAKRVLYEVHIGQIRVRGMMVLAVRGERGYVVTCTAVPETFDAFRPTFDQIVGTFRFE